MDEKQQIDERLTINFISSSLIGRIKYLNGPHVVLEPYFVHACYRRRLPSVSRPVTTVVKPQLLIYSGVASREKSVRSFLGSTGTPF